MILILPREIFIILKAVLANSVYRDQQVYDEVMLGGWYSGELKST